MARVLLLISLTCVYSTGRVVTSPLESIDILNEHQRVLGRRFTATPGSAFLTYQGNERKTKDKVLTTTVSLEACGMVCVLYSFFCTYT